jgi:prevent-host-death family protein
MSWSRLTCRNVAAINIYQAKTQFSRLLRRVRAGEEFVIADAGKPIARLVPFVEGASRRLGGDEGSVWVADDFDAPLPAELLSAFWAGASQSSRSSKRGRRRRAGRR